MENLLTKLHMRQQCPHKKVSLQKGSRCNCGGGGGGGADKRRIQPELTQSLSSASHNSNNSRLTAATTSKATAVGGANAICCRRETRAQPLRCRFRRKGDPRWMLCTSPCYIKYEGNGCAGDLTVVFLSLTAFCYCLVALQPAAY